MMLGLAWIPAIAAAGGVLALGPIIIHIIFRRRYRILDFAAMRFLLDSLKQRRQRLRLEELIIIALRVLICLLAGLMLANIRAESVLAGGGAPMAHVYILDDSLSMGQQVGTETLHQKALAYLVERLRAVGDDDLVAVLSASRPDGPGAPGADLRPARDVKREDVLARLLALRPTDLAASLPEALGAAKDLLARQIERPGRIYLISDFRQRDVVPAERAEALRQAFKGAADARAELVLWDFGLPCPTNLTIERIVPGRRLVVAGMPTPLRVEVRNQGTRPVEGAKVTASIHFGSGISVSVATRHGERVATETEIRNVVVLPAGAVPALGPGQSAAVEFEYAFPAAGAAAVRVAASADALPADSRASLALDVRSALRVLIVDGSREPLAFGSDSWCLARALDPSGRGDFGQCVDVVGAGSPLATDLPRYDLVVLTNVRDFPVLRDPRGEEVCPALAAIERYVRDGGGLAVFLGDRIDPEFYNAVMYAQGAGLSPLRLLGLPPKTDEARFVRLRADSIGPDPMLRIFTGRRERFAGLVRFYGFVPAEVAPPARLAEGVGPAEVLARFDDPAGSPAVARRTFGRGTVIVWYTGPGLHWSNWPKSLSFLPVINDMAWELVRAAGQEFDDRVGRRITYPLPAGLLDATAITLKTPAWPEEDLQSLATRGEGNQKVLSYAGPDHAGVYEVEFVMPDRSRQTVLFSRHVDPTEGDLAKATEAQIAAAVGQRHRYVGDLAGRHGRPAEEQRPLQAYWWVFAALVLVLLGLELVLAQLFGHYARTTQDPYRSREATRHGGRPA